MRPDSPHKSQTEQANQFALSSISYDDTGTYITSEFAAAEIKNGNDNYRAQRLGKRRLHHRRRCRLPRAAGA